MICDGLIEAISVTNTRTFALGVQWHPEWKHANDTLSTAIFRAFLDRYFPFTPPEEKTVADPGKDNARVAGYYLASRRKESALRLLFQLGQTEVAPQPDGIAALQKRVKEGFDPQGVLGPGRMWAGA